MKGLIKSWLGFIDYAEYIDAQFYDLEARVDTQSRCIADLQRMNRQLRRENETLKGEQDNATE